MSRVTYGLTALALAAVLSACGQKAAGPVTEASAPAIPNLAMVQASDRTSGQDLPTVVVSARRGANRS